MTSQNQGTSALLDQTVQALSGSATAVSPTDGTSLIDSWISALGSDSPVADTLSDLKTAIQGGDASGADIQDMLTDLADQTQSAAASADSSTQSSLQSLAASLKSFGKQLA